MIKTLPMLDQRLSFAESLFTVCDIGADIGADHGRLSCCLLAHNTCARMIVSDISTDSLKKSERLLATHGLSERARFAVADGLDALDEPVGALAICGMGGAVIAKILIRGQDKLADATLILSAHTDLPVLRRTVYDIGYHMDKELIAHAGGRRYVVMRAVRGKEALSDYEAYIGKCLLRDRPEGFDDYLAWREGVIMREWSPGEQLTWIRKAMKHHESDGSDIR